jgi:ADP-ribose pyrophosphatase YjhB (NUDIX family)
MLNAVVDLADQCGAQEVRLFGSVANGTDDQWSDLDVALTAAPTVLATLFPSTDWLAPLGEVFAADQSTGERWCTTRLVFVTLQRIDLALIPDTLPVRERPGRCVWQRPRSAAQAGTEQAALPQPIQQDGMPAVAGRVRFEAVQAVVTLVRGDLLIAAHLALGLQRHCLVGAMLLRDLLEGHDHHRNGGLTDGPWNAIPPVLRTCQHPYTPAGILRSIAATIDTFDSMLALWPATHQPDPSGEPLRQLITKAGDTVRSTGQRRPCWSLAIIPKLRGVEAQLTAPIGRRAARAILIDDHGRLVLIKRTKAGQAPYWTAPGGGVEGSDASVEAALHRELAEELGAEAVGASQVFLFSAPSDAGVAVQHFFVARLTSLDTSARSGPEFSDASPARGGYELDRVDLRGDDLASIDLKPTALKDFILANREALLVEALAAA